MFDLAQAFRDISKGDDSAFAFMFQLWSWLQLQDDLFDRDKPITATQVAQGNFAFIATLAKNTFFQRHCDSILPILLNASLAWKDSERLNSSSNPVDQITSQVLKSEYLNVFLYVAFVKGTYEHAARMSELYRQYSFDMAPQAPDK